MLNVFAGPIELTTDDTLQILLFLLIVALPFVFIGIGIILLIRDAIKKRIHRSTVIFFGIGLLLFLLLKLASGII